MIPKVHAKGSSFKGVSAYLLHDKEASSSERVVWAESRNIAATNPDTAWRIMAATALDQDRLKENAGIPNTGRKSNKAVLHFTLSWHPEQTPNKAEMMKAANGAIRTLGASSHQSMIIAHDDEDHTHLHVVVNRVSPEDGRMLSSSKEKLKLSRWAEAYEKEGGKIYCDNRVTNNSLRDEKHFVRGEKDVPRNIFEEQNKVAANDNPYREAMRLGQKKKDAEIALLGRNQVKAHKAAWIALDEQNGDVRAEVKARTTQNVSRSTDRIVKQYKPKIQEMHKRHQAEMKTFQSLEENLFGRAKNVITSVKLLNRIYGEERGNLITQSFLVMANGGKRLEVIRKAHARELVDLRRQKNAEIKANTHTIKTEEKVELVKIGQSYLAARQSLEKSQDKDSDKLRLSWRERGKERASAWDKLSMFSAKRSKPRRDKSLNRDELSKGHKASLKAQYDRMVEREKPKDAANNNRNKNNDG